MSEKNQKKRRPNALGAGHNRPPQRREGDTQQPDAQQPDTSAAAAGPNASTRKRYCKVCGCEIVHAEIDEEGLCGPCGLRARRGQLPPAGSRCVVCGERRRRNLTVWPLSGDPVCHACVFYLKESRPWPEDPRQVAWRLRRERRRKPRQPCPAESAQSPPNDDYKQ